MTVGMRADHLAEFVVIPTLSKLAELTGNARINTPSAIKLIMGTVAHESKMCHYLRQHPTGPARGIGQMEPATYDSLWNNYLKHRPELAAAVRSFASVNNIDVDTAIPGFTEVIGNLPFAVAMMRVRYLPAKPPLPAEDDLEGLAEYHVKFYNRGGGAEVHEFVRDYKLYVSTYV